MPEQECVKLVYVCPKCGEAIEPIILRAEVKILYKAFKIPLPYRNKWVDEQMQKIRRQKP